MSAEVIRHRLEYRPFDATFEGARDSSELKKFCLDAFQKWQSRNNVFSLGHVYHPVSNKVAKIHALVFQVNP